MPWQGTSTVRRTASPYDIKLCFMRTVHMSIALSRVGLSDAARTFVYALWNWVLGKLRTRVPMFPMRTTNKYVRWTCTVHGACARIRLQLNGIWRIASRDETRPGRAEFNSVRARTHTCVVVYLYLTSAKCAGIAAFSLWPEATALTEMVKVELHEWKKMKFL